VQPKIIVKQRVAKALAKSMFNYNSHIASNEREYLKVKEMYDLAKGMSIRKKLRVNGVWEEATLVLKKGTEGAFIFSVCVPNKFVKSFEV